MRHSSTCLDTSKLKQAKAAREQLNKAKEHAFSLSNGTSTHSGRLSKEMSEHNFKFQPVSHTSTLELSRSAFRSNVAFVRQTLGSDTQLSAVLKGNAYGHGIEQMSALCLEEEIRHFSVFSAHEAARILHKVQQPLTILIMGLIDSADLPWAIANEVEFFVFEFERLKAAVAAAKAVGKKARIHLELETGMNRTGFTEEEIPTLMELMQQHPQELELISLCTHFAGAEEMANYLRIRQQLERYNSLYQTFVTAGLAPHKRHTACSAALLNYPETKMNLVRIGIMLYGYWPNVETRIRYQRQRSAQTDPLRRIISWKSKVMSLKSVSFGEFVGYGTSFLAPKNMRIATVPVGYAYGFPRGLSNTGRVLIREQEANVVGVVNMNLIMVDVTDIAGVQPGDEVVLIGQQGERAISVASFSEMSQQLNYEMLTRLPLDIPRIIVD